MSISSLRETLKDLPGATTLVMNYEPETGYQLYQIGEIVVRVEPNASVGDIRAAFLEGGLA